MIFYSLSTKYSGFSFQCMLAIIFLWMTKIIKCLQYLDEWNSILDWIYSCGNRIVVDVIQNINFFFHLIILKKKDVNISYKYSQFNLSLYQTHCVVLNLCLELLHDVIISHDKARSNRWCQWLGFSLSKLSISRTVNFSNRDNGWQEFCWVCTNLSCTAWIQFILVSKLK